MSTIDPLGRPAEILLVEDDDIDVRLTEESFKRSKFATRLHRVANGAECMAFLRREGAHADAPRPDLVLLDLDMPVMTGQEVLAELVEDEELRHLPVVVLTTSEDDQDVLDMYRLRCSAYITKPVSFANFHEVIKTLADYWFTVVVLPENGRPGAATPARP